MKKSKLEQVLRRKVRIKITRRKRGRFRVLIPSDLGSHPVAYFSKKRDALTWLYTELRCITPKIIRVDIVPMDEQFIAGEEHTRLTLGL